MAARSQGPRPDVLARRADAAKRESAASGVPSDMTAAETELWVDGDRKRALAALEAEHRRDNPRSTLITTLERLTHDDTEV